MMYRLLDKMPSDKIATIKNDAKLFLQQLAKGHQ